LTSAHLPTSKKNRGEGRKREDGKKGGRELSRHDAKGKEPNPAFSLPKKTKGTRTMRGENERCRGRREGDRCRKRSEDTGIR